jgi:NADPH-dependent glutamate synthase beta subunit-like oxidoreductase
VDVARTAVRAGGERVSMYCPEREDEMPAQAKELEEAAEEGISVYNSWGPKRVLTERGRAVGVEFKRCVSVFDENKRFAPKYDEGETITVKADCVLLSVGQAIAWGDLLKGSAAVLNANGTLSVDEFTYQSAQPDIFAGGDAVTGPKFAIDAIAAGKQAAISIHRFVRPGQDLRLGRSPRRFIELDKRAAVVDSYDNTPRQRAEHADGERSKETFRDLRGVLTEEQIKKETERCLGCGATVVDEYMCVGCGQCTTQCRFDAIHLERRFDGEGVEMLKMKPVVVRQMVKRKVKIAARKLGNAVIPKKHRDA